MTVEELTLEVLAERLLTEFDSKKLVDWAVSTLQLGYESENLYVLAGLDNDLTEEREKYFRKAVEDLHIDTEKTEDELIHSYALTIARKAIQKETSVDYAFSQLLKIVYASDYDYRYLPFLKLGKI